MARPLRIEYAGALYHVTSRGDRREDIFYDDEDRTIWLDVFAQVCSRFNWRCHAWCLMDNHYHIVIETVEGNLSRGMRQLNGVYTQKSNRRHHLSGHVFQGRYKAILIDKDNYLLELSRYVVLNPVRAGMVKDVEDWPWSSYGAMIGQAEQPEWLETDWLLACFGKSRKRAIATYMDFVRAGIGLPSIWENLKYQLYLGHDDFITSIQERFDSATKDELQEVSRVQRRPMAKPLDWYVDNNQDKKTAMVLAYQTGAYSMKEIAQQFGVHYSTVSRAIKSLEENA
ncbi:MAG: REP-associated tyrosine transposase [Thiotrichales bacterium]